jgi:NADPH:quinone reductase-like Zn-dependent oxidoreductase
VLVCGASGAIGSSAVQLAKHFGAVVTGVCSTNNLELVKSLGADAVIDYTSEDVTSRGELYDLILDAVPADRINRKAFKASCGKVLAPNGKHVSIDDGRPDMSLKSLVLLKELAETGRIRPVIDRCYALEEITSAHQYVDTGRKRGNVVVNLRARATQAD